MAKNSSTSLKLEESQMQEFSFLENCKTFGCINKTRDFIYYKYTKIIANIFYIK